MLYLRSQDGGISIAPFLRFRVIMRVQVVRMRLKTSSIESVYHRERVELQIGEDDCIKLWFSAPACLL